MAGKPKRKKAQAPITIAEPTPEQIGKGDFTRVGMSYRRTPVIEKLYEEHKLTSRQFNGLARYRDVAIAEDSSPIEDSVGKMMRGACGGGEGLSPRGVRIAIELGRLERALGSLRDVARAIAVDDRTLSDWAMERHGSREHLDKGVVRIKPHLDHFNIVWIDIRMAGERLAAEIGA